MANKRDCDKRLKGFGIPIEVCVKYERMAGIKHGDTPTKQQRETVTKLMVTALTVYASTVTLTADDYEDIAKEVKENEAR